MVLEGLGMVLGYFLTFSTPLYIVPLDVRGAVASCKYSQGKYNRLVHLVNQTGPIIYQMGLVGGFIILASCKFPFIRVFDNLV